MSAATVRLGDVATFVRGITFKPADVLDEVTADAVGCMRTKNVQAQLDETDVWFLPKNFVANKNQVLQEGDLLVSTANSWNLVGKACWVPKLNYDCTFGGFISALRAKDGLVDRRYLYYWFTSAKIQAKLRSFGNKTTNISNLSIKRSNDLVIPLPPLAEQQRIAAILDKAAEIKAKREQAIAKLDELAQSTFVEMFGDPNSNPKQWDVKCLQEICHKISDIDHKMPKAVDKGYPFISAKDLVKYGKIDFTNVKFISKEDFDRLSRKIKPESGDILYSRIGAIGRARLVEVQFDFLASYSCCTIKPKLELVLKEFLCDLLDSPAILKQAHKGVKGIAVPDLGMSEIRSFQIILPPKHLQQRYIDFKTAHKSQLENMFEDLMKINSLVSSLQHQAFTTGFNA